MILAVVSVISRPHVNHVRNVLKIYVEFLIVVELNVVKWVINSEQRVVVPVIVVMVDFVIILKNYLDVVLIAMDLVDVLNVVLRYFRVIWVIAKIVVPVLNLVR